MSRHHCQPGCQGIQPLTPLTTQNRAGLDALRYRVGKHASFFETMLARISTVSVAGRDEAERIRPLLDSLLARNPDDPSIALLDGWSTVADILTFYQEQTSCRSNRTFFIRSISPVE